MLTWGLSAAAAQAATGLEPGVHVDPGSPAAKEYALPLNQARQTGAGASSSSTSSGPLFGAGIKPPGAGGSSHSGSGSGSGTGKATGRGGAAGPNGASGAARLSTLPAAVLRASSSQASSGGGGSILALLGGGVAILVLGGLGGMILKRSRHSAAST